jgi:hypothetical protein
MSTPRNDHDADKTDPVLSLGQRLTRVSALRAVRYATTMMGIVVRETLHGGGPVERAPGSTLSGVDVSTDNGTVTAVTTYRVKLPNAEVHAYEIRMTVTEIDAS